MTDGKGPEGEPKLQPKRQDQKTRRGLAALARYATTQPGRSILEEAEKLAQEVEGDPGIKRRKKLANAVPRIMSQQERLRKVAPHVSVAQQHIVGGALGELELLKREAIPHPGEVLNDGKGHNNEAGKPKEAPNPNTDVVTLQAYRTMFDKLERGYQDPDTNYNKTSHCRYGRCLSCG